MADENADLDLNTDAGSADAGAGKKKGGLKSIFPQIIKWTIIAVVAIIFVVTVVLITEWIRESKGGNQTKIPISDEFTEKREVYDWYTSLDQIKTTTSDPIPASVVIQVALGYKKDDKKASTEITQRTVEIRDFLRRYFSEKTSEDLKPQNEDKLKIEIRDQINDDILSDSKIKDIKFLTKDVVQQ